jgi:hypothetical protein
MESLADSESGERRSPQWGGPNGCELHESVPKWGGPEPSGPEQVESRRDETLRRGLRCGEPP